VSKRQEFRQHSKSTLLRATEVMFRERDALKARAAAVARIWRRRLVWSVLAALVIGFALGVVVRLTDVPLVPYLLSR
jgi:hypothetical protein